MSKTVTLRLNEKVYQLFRGMAAQDNRSLSNFIETAALRFVEEHDYVDEFELKDIKENTSLNRSINKGIQDAKAGQGRFV